MNRYLLKQENQKLSLILPTANPQILQILDYINAHLTQDLSIDKIADAAFLNRSYLMHLFRDETGYTIGKYITEKRLYLANHAIEQGVSVTDACYQSGFRNYTTFYQASSSLYSVFPISASYRYNRELAESAQRSMQQDLPDIPRQNWCVLLPA